MAFRASPARRGPCRNGEKEVEGRRPIVCMLSVSAVALLVAVGLYSHYCPCWGPAAKRRSKDGEDRRTAEEPAAVLGFYSDPKHARPGSLAGVRLLASTPGGDTGAVTLVGSDD